MTTCVTATPSKHHGHRGDPHIVSVDAEAAAGSGRCCLQDAESVEGIEGGLCHWMARGSSSTCRLSSTAFRGSLCSHQGWKVMNRKETSASDAH